MKTPENILYDRGITLIDCISSSMYDATVKAMESYAEQQALGFEEFINQEYMVYDFDEDLGEVVFKKAHWPNSKAPLLTIKQLYQKFKEEQK